MNEIKMKVGEENSLISKYLKTLIDLGIVRKETPVTEKREKRPSICWRITFFGSGTGLYLLI